MSFPTSSNLSKFKPSRLLLQISALLSLSSSPPSRFPPLCASAHTIVLPLKLSGISLLPIKPSGKHNRRIEQRLALDMDLRRCKSVGWANLPPKLLRVISDGLGNPADKCRFRWVCRSWRLSTSPPSNKLSPFFPVVLHYSELQPRRCLTINASTVYLIRPRHDRSKASWMASLEEPVAGKLVLRHAVTYAEIPGSLPAPDDDDWIVTQVARSYAHNVPCKSCNGIDYTERAAVVTNRNTNSLVGLCRMEDFWREMVAFELGLSGEEGTRVIHLDLDCGYRPTFADFVSFNGWIYAVDYAGCVFVVDRDQLRLHLVCSCDLRRYKEYNDFPYKIRLVASDGDYLYVVFSRRCTRFRIYRLVVSSRNCNNGMITSGKWERVNDLGDRVLFLAKNCSFFVSASDLPRPWKGNSLVALGDVPTCKCGIMYYGKVEEDRVVLFSVGGKRSARVLNSMHLSQGYSELFAAPNLLNANIQKKKMKKKHDHVIF